MRVCFSHLSWLGNGYWLCCYHDGEIWGDDLFVKKWHGKAGFHLLQHNSGFERSSVQWLIYVICSFHCDRKMFPSCFSRKTEYLHPKKAGILLPFVKLFQLPTENGFPRTSNKIFWDVITTISPAPSLFAFYEFLVWETENLPFLHLCVQYSSHPVELL